MRETRAGRNVQCYLAQFNRRLERGQCHHTPYLGTREFAAGFEKPDGKEIIPDLNMQLGTMLFDLAFIPTDKAIGKFEFKLPSRDGNKKVFGFKRALFYDATIINGKITVPIEKYSELYALEETSHV